jgi:aspartate carbamoyltransferase
MGKSWPRLALAEISSNYPRNDQFYRQGDNPMNHHPASQPNPHLPFGDQRTAPWYGKDILSVKQFSRSDLEYIFAVAHEMHVMVDRVGTFDLLKGKILANLFYEPSTRTSSSFTSAMERLGGSVIPINEVRYSSVAKGESLPDTVRTLECYADVIVLRHPETGSAALAAKYAKKPIINAGDGIGEHPTQALLDAFTIHEEMGMIDGLTVTMLGDLKYGRTVHSLARLLSLYNARVNYISPEILRMPAEIIEELPRTMAQKEYTDLDEALPTTDVLYVTRVQKERFANEAEYESVKGCYVITPEIMQAAKKDMIVMHPLPRVGEISMEFDDDPRAAYFRQMEYGLYVRMALLAMVLGKA